MFSWEWTNFLKQQKQPPEVFRKKGVLKNFAIFTRKHLCWSLFGVLGVNFIKKRLQHRYFPVNITKLLRKSILKNIWERLHFEQLFQRTLVSSVWWTIVAKFNLKHRLISNRIKTSPKLNFSTRRLSQSLHVKLISETKLIYTFTCILFLIYCPSWLVVLLIRFDLIKILLFWNGILKSNGSDGPSRPIAAIIFCRTNINDSPSSAFAIKTHW